MDFLKQAEEDNKLLKQIWDKAYAKYKHVFSVCPEDLSFDALTNKGIEIYIQETLYDTLGATRIDKDTYKIVQVALSDEIFYFKPEYAFNVVLHEMAHVASIFIDKENCEDDFDLECWHEDWLDEAGHNDTWHELVDELNSEGCDIVDVETDEELTRYYEKLLKTELFDSLLG